MKTRNSRLRTAKPKDGNNVFADLGLPNPEQELLKADLTLRIYTMLKERGVNQTEAAALLGIQQPRVSQLLRNRPGTFSVVRLMEFLTMLGHDVKISVEPARKRKGQVFLLGRHRDTDAYSRTEIPRPGRTGGAPTITGTRKTG